jgi:hypothetical protein
MRKEKPARFALAGSFAFSGSREEMVCSAGDVLMKFLCVIDRDPSKFLAAFALFLNKSAVRQFAYKSAVCNLTFERF